MRVTRRATRFFVFENLLHDTVAVDIGRQEFHRRKEQYAISDFLLMGGFVISCVLSYAKRATYYISH